ncbi:cyclic nucleotide-binding domain-containing protein [Dokdonella sp.]|uniref:cyclic nucleotide-binding domain-containing protein n=1 Tax=Dokdonella sp. TaxID=2291710 RepID=UPI003C4FF7C6
MSKTAEFTLDVPAGQAVFAEGDPGQTLFIVESGVVEIFLAARGEEPVARLGPGEFFGELSMLSGQPRSASAIASEPARLLRIEREAFAGLLSENVEIAVSIMRTLAQRHLDCENQLTEALLTSSGAGKPSGSGRAAPSTAALPKSREAGKAARNKPEPPAVPSPPPPPPSSPSTRAACLLKHADGKSFPLDPGMNEFLVGRPDPSAGINPEVNLSSVDPTRSLSRKHAKLVRQGQLFFVREESGTVNGTFVNNVRVVTGVDVPIKPGDKLRFGAVEVEFAAA